MGNFPRQTFFEKFFYKKILLCLKEVDEEVPTFVQPKKNSAYHGTTTANRSLCELLSKKFSNPSTLADQWKSDYEYRIRRQCISFELKLVDTNKIEYSIFYCHRVPIKNLI